MEVDLGGNIMEFEQIKEIIIQLINSSDLAFFELDRWKIATYKNG